MSDLALYQFLKQEITAAKEEIMASAREQVQQIVTQLGHVKTEISDELVKLRKAIVDGTVSTEDLQPLQSVVQGLDDIVPDAPADQP